MLVERLGAERNPGEPCWEPHGWAPLGREWPGMGTVHPSRPGGWVTLNHVPDRGCSRRET